MHRYIFRNRSEITSQYFYPSLGLSHAISAARSMGERQNAEVVSERFLSVFLLFVVTCLVSGCGPSTEDTATDANSESADSVVVSEMEDLERNVPDVEETIGNEPQTGAEPATVVDFSSWQGNDVTWEIAEGKAEELYAEKNFTNETAPNLVVEKWIGEQPELSGDKFLLVDFWATWCPPCRAAIPELNKISKEFADQLVVMGISNESVSKVQEMQEPVIEYYSAVDTQGRTDAEIGIQGIPHVMLIDPSGKVAWQGFPMGDADPLTAERIHEIIDLYHAAKAE